MRCRVWGSLLASAVAAGSVHAQQWQMPRTSWGEPDLQGTWSNDNEYATPLERPAQFAGKTIRDITPEDLAADTSLRRLLCVGLRHD